MQTNYNPQSDRKTMAATVAPQLMFKYFTLAIEIALHARTRLHITIIVSISGVSVALLHMMSSHYLLNVSEITQ